MAMVGVAPGRFFLCSDDLENQNTVEWDSIAMQNAAGVPDVRAALPQVSVTPKLPTCNSANAPHDRGRGSHGLTVASLPRS